VRKYWKGDDGQLQELSSRLMGSSDLYQDDGREPYNSVNMITAHDGFTLADLVSYNEKHNEANGENNQDGCNNNDSWNCGAEGATDDPAIQALRRRQMKNLLATLLLSQGVPMISGGDEFGRSQGGNNNAYCQDNEISWFNWNFTPDQKELLDFAAKVVQFRKDHPNFRRHKFVRWRRIHPEESRDAIWYSPHGREMTEEDWHTPFAKTIGLLLDGSKLEWQSPEGELVSDDTFLLLLNAHHEAIDFVLPEGRWTPVLHTSDGKLEMSGGKARLEARSLAVLTQPLKKEGAVS
jgi:glycogen operon protein